MSDRPDNVIPLNFRPDNLVCECGEGWFAATVVFGKPDSSGVRKITGWLSRHASGEPAVFCNSCGKAAEVL